MPASRAGADPAKNVWPQQDGTPVDCREKLKLLQENYAELSQVLRDCFEDAVLMGVSPEALRQLFHASVDALRDPRKADGSRND